MSIVTLNQDCTCITLDRGDLSRALARQTGDPAFAVSLVETRPHLFSGVAVFISTAQLKAMQRIVAGIESVARNPAYRDVVLGWAPESARRDFGPRGMFMGYDFHMAPDGPALIEVNTNAGGAMLNAVLARAQQSCCTPVTLDLQLGNFEGAVAHMVRAEWTHQRGSGHAVSIAIVDDDPAGQFLYPEFLLAQRLLVQHGHSVVIADPSELEYRAGTLRHGGRQIDLVYNRLVDFSLDEPGHLALRQAYLEGATVVTPNPHIHALFADKRNLALLSEQALLRQWGIDETVIETLAQGVPATEQVIPATAERLWADRKRLFFKPAGGYGSKAAYRGDKLTKSTWSEILRGGYISQAFVPPSERLIRLDGELQSRKIDVRLYTYEGRILLAAARLYRGQTTNMRTPGGGFAPVLLAAGTDVSAVCAKCGPEPR